MARLETNRLTLAVPGKTLCRDLNLALEAGENWAILGANGSGKTTLLHALAGLRRPDAGGVRLNGHEVHGMAPRARARSIGVLFQDYDAAFPVTVYETVLTGRHPHQEPWHATGLEDHAATRGALAELDLAAFTERWLASLSGGERRRVEIAALLAQDSPICLADEPTNHLDLHHQVAVLALLSARSRRSGHLNVFVLHDVNLAARFCTHALLLFGDGACLHGPMDAVLNRDALERAYGCELQEIMQDGRRYFLPA